MIVRTFVLVILLLFTTSVIAQDKFSYTPGVSFNVEPHRPQDAGNNYE